MGKLENRCSRMIYHKLIQRIQTFRNHPRYGFMFENATVGGDTMAEMVAICSASRSDGTPMTIMQLAGFPAEVVELGGVGALAAWRSTSACGATASRRCCSSARRRTAMRRPTKIGFGPTRRALSRIAKEGRKYGVFLGLVTQRPAEIDPTIMSQCSTLFVMRLSNDRDQALIRSAVSDAGVKPARSSFPRSAPARCSLSAPACALPTRMKFRELRPERAADQRGRRQHPLRAGTNIGPRPDRLGHRSLAHRDHEPSRGDFDDDGEDLRLPRIEAAPLLQPAGLAPQRPSAARRSGRAACARPLSSR